MLKNKLKIYINWKATVNKTEKKLVLDFFYKSKYSCRVWNTIQNKKNLVICRIELCRGVRIYGSLFCGKCLGQSSEEGIPIEPSQALSFTPPAVLCCGCPGWLLVTAVCSQHRAELLPWAPLSALPEQCSFPPCWEAEVLPHHRDIFTASALREMSMLLCIVENTLENLCLSRNGLTSGLIAWEPGSQTGLLICSSLIAGASIFWVIWQDVRPLNRSSNWDILALWCGALALKPGRGWDRMELSQAQNLYFLEGNLRHS